MNKQPIESDVADSQPMNKNQNEPIEIISTPVRLGLVTAVVVSIGGLAWTIFAKIPIYVNGYAYLIESGNQRSIPTKTEGELSYLIGSEGPQAHTQLSLLNLLYDIGQSSKPITQDQVVYAAEQILDKQIKPPQVNVGQYIRREFNKSQALAWIDSSLQRDNLNAAYLKRSLAKRKLEGVQDETARINKALIDQKNILSQQLVSETKFLVEIRELNKIQYASEARLLAQESRVKEIQSLILETDEKVAKNTNRVVNAKIQYDDSNVQLRAQTQEYIDRCLVFAYRSLYVERMYYPQTSRVKRGQYIMSISVSENQVLNSGIAGFMTEQNAQQAGKGMPALLTPLGMDKAQYGGIIGEIIDVNQLPLSTPEISTVIGSDALAQDLKQLIDNPVVLNVKLARQDNSKELNEAGFKWSSRGAKPFKVRTGDILSLQVTTRRISPISLFIPWLRKISGVSSPEILDKR